MSCPSLTAQCCDAVKLCNQILVVDEVLWVLKEIRLGWMQAVMVVADAEVSLTITGNGDVLEPYDGVIGEEISLITVCVCI